MSGKERPTLLIFLELTFLQRNSKQNNMAKNRPIRPVSKKEEFGKEILTETDMNRLLQNFIYADV